MVNRIIQRFSGLVGASSLVIAAAFTLVTGTAGPLLHKARSEELDRHRSLNKKILPRRPHLLQSSTYLLVVP